MTERCIYTIGHSNRSLAEFVAILEEAAVSMVVDVRTMPRSRTNPQYNVDKLPDNLTPFAIGYRHIPELGGLRAKARTVPEEINGFWQNRSFHNYADHALSETFGKGLQELLALSRDETCALMCAEAVWWRCHRRIIADHLLARGKTVIHLLDAGNRQAATQTSGARIQPDGTVTYPTGKNA